MITLSVIYLSLLVFFPYAEDTGEAFSPAETESLYMYRDSVLQELKSCSTCEGRWQDDKEAYMRNIPCPWAEMEFKMGKKDSACIHYQQYLELLRNFYDTALEEQRMNVQNNYLIRKAESAEAHMLTLLLCVTAILLFIGVLSSLKLYFNRTGKVAHEQRLTSELEESYKSAELLNRDSEMLLLRLRECMGEPLDKVVKNVDRLSEQGLDGETKQQILSELTENAWSLNSMITDFLNRARSQVGKPALE